MATWLLYGKRLLNGSTSLDHFAYKKVLKNIFSHITRSSLVYQSRTRQVLKWQCHNYVHYVILRRQILFQRHFFTFVKLHLHRLFVKSQLAPQKLASILDRKASQLFMTRQPASTIFPQKGLKLLVQCLKLGCQHFHAQHCSNDTV